MCDVYLHTRVPLWPLPSGTYTIDLVPVKRPDRRLEAQEPFADAHEARHHLELDPVRAPCATPTHLSCW